MIFEEVTIGKCRLILGDCVDVLQSLEAQSVDAEKAKKLKEALNGTIIATRADYMGE